MRLISRVHAGGSEILDLAVHQQPERTSAIWLAKIESQTMRFRESGERQQFEITEITMRQQIGEHVVAVLVPCPTRRTRVPTEHDFERRVRRIAREIFIGINLDVRGMI